MIVTGLPARTSTERLDKLDDELHVSIIGGDHRLENYHSTTSLHGTEGGQKTVVMESYVVDVPAGNSKEETCVFVDTIIDVRLEEDMFVQREAEEPKPLGATNLGGDGREADTHEMTIEINLMASSGRSGSGQVGRGDFDEEQRATYMLLHRLHE
ncbi:hypothetical protein EZV62_026878 [Acer yangbiense]|uniref:Uncharacterized protein n=1 Tax=Acer yangbiense TaxID=1000413 RepID=A0A5C7GS14_9ROSI|nr:hypothetical protein EZV62_026878 [Acer yangbiense]